MLFKKNAHSLLHFIKKSNILIGIKSVYKLFFQGLSMDIATFFKAFAFAYIPGAVLALIIWLLAKRREPMPLFRADILGWFVPLIVWVIMHKYNWSFVHTTHNGAMELMILGWIWSAAFIGRLLIPRFTHKLRFRLASLYVWGIAGIAAIALALFYK